MEVFISTTRDPLRNLMRQLVCEFWREVGVIPTIGYKTYPQRWAWAEASARGDIYCLADDDCLPNPHLDVGQVLRFFEEDDWSILALNNLVEYGHQRTQIKESHAVGGIRFIRRGRLTFPSNFTGDDSEVIPNGKVGYLDVGMIHLGLWHSQWRQRGN